MDDRIAFFINGGDLYVEFALKKIDNFCLSDRLACLEELV